MAQFKRPTTLGLINNGKHSNDATNTIVETLGYTTKGDGGAAQWRKTGVTGLTPSQTPALLADAKLTDANGHEWELVASIVQGTPTVFIAALGAAIDGVTDDYAEINAAIQFFKRKYVAGGVVDLGIGVVGVASELIVDHNGIMLRGYGRGDYTNSKFTSRQSAATRLLWLGAAGQNMVRFTSDAANTGAEVRKSDGGIVGVCLDGNEVAATCLEVKSWNSGEWYLTTCYPTGHHWLFDTLTNGVTGSAADSQHNNIDIISHDVNTSNEPTTLGILHGDTSANTSLNYLRSLILTAESSAIALEFGGCDGNKIDYLRAGTRAAAVGDGGKVIFHADDTMTTVPDRGDHARYNDISFVQAVRGIESLATVAGTKSAEDNTIGICSGGNGAPFPSIEAGSTLSVAEYNGTRRLSNDSSAVAYTAHRPSAAPNASLGSYRWQSENTAGALKTYSRISSRVVDNTAGTEDGQYDFYNLIGGAEVRVGFMWRGLVIGSSGAGDRGDGTVSISGQYYVGNTQVLDGRKTGWTNPTGTATRTGFVTSTATTQQLAETLKALIDDLSSHGMIGS